MKKSLAILLIILMLLSVAPLAAMSDVLPKWDFDLAVTAQATGDTPYLTSGYCGDTSGGKDGTDIAWALDNDGTLTLTGTGKMGSTPNREDNRVKKLIVGEGITGLADYAFFECFNLADVEIPSTLQTIGEKAFAYCNIDDIAFPDTLFSIGQYAFEGNMIASVSFGSGLDTIPEGLFFGNETLTSADIPATILTVEDGAFSGCRLNEITLHEGLLSVGARAFEESTVANFTFPDSVKTIGGYVFSNGQLQTVHLGKDLEYIDDEAFNSFYGRDNVLLKAVYVSNENAVYYDYDGILYNKANDQPYIIPKGKNYVAFKSNNGYVCVL